MEEDLEEEDIEDEMSEQEEDLNLEDLQNKNNLSRGKKIEKKWTRGVPDNNNTLGFITPSKNNYNETKPVSNYINYALLNDSNRDKNNINALIVKKVNAFIKEQS